MGVSCWDAPLRLASKTAFLQTVQEINGIGFDERKAEALAVHIKEEMSKIEVAILPQLPDRPLKKAEEHEFQLPVKPFKMDGTYSSHMERFLVRHSSCVAAGRTLVWLDGKEYPIVGGFLLPAKKPMNLSNQNDLKDWFIAQGWEPTLWNLKKDDSGKPLRDAKKKTINTSPKMQENGRLCPNLERMSGELVKPVVKWLSYRNRLSVLEGWLANPRLAFDGRLTAASSGITNTYRQRHSVVCNVPKNKKDVLLGREVRELFVAFQDQVLVGYDASSLEERIKGSLTWKYDDGAYASKILQDGFDPHQETANLWGIDRQVAKSGNYLLNYGGGAGKLAATIKCTKREAVQRHEDYWNFNSALKSLDEALGAHWEANDRKWIRGLDGRKVWSRHRHSLVNLAIQSTASILMDYSLAWLDRKLGGVSQFGGRYLCYNVGKHRAFRVGFFHDEAIFSCDPEIAEHVAALGKESIKKAGEYYNLKVPLLSEAKIASNWSLIH